MSQNVINIHEHENIKLFHKHFVMLLLEMYQELMSKYVISCHELKKKNFDFAEAKMCATKEKCKR